MNDIKEVTNIQTTYRANGMVWGNNWGGGQSGWISEILTSDDYDDLIQQIEHGIETGDLDSGMGYESLVGAGIVITTITTIEYMSKEFTNEEKTILFFGNLNNATKEFISLHLNLYL